jgi:hypothetical protein
MQAFWHVLRPIRLLVHVMVGQWVRLRALLILSRRLLRLLLLLLVPLMDVALLAGAVGVASRLFLRPWLVDWSVIRDGRRRRSVLETEQRVPQ